MLRGDFVEVVEKIDGIEFRTVDGNGSSRFKTDLHFFGLVRSFLWRNNPLPHGFVWCVGGILELATFVAEVPDVAVAAINVFLALLDWDVVFLRVSDGVFA